MKGLVFLFPGQGSQYIGMGKELCDDFAIARQTFEEANEALGFDLQQLCFSGDLEELTKTTNTQPAILTASVASFRVFMQEYGIYPEYTAGHSLGEYSALVCTGALKFTDAVQAVQKRGQFMQEAVPLGTGAMMAVMKLNREVVDKICAEVSTEGSVVVPANYNSDEQIVISGNAETVKLAGQRLQEAGATVKLLNVSAPFHSSLMKPAALKMNNELKQLTYGKMRWPVISNVTAKPYSTTDSLIENLTEQIYSPVRWHESMVYLNRCGVKKAIEMGPKNVLKGILKRSFPGIEVRVLENRSHLDALKDYFPPEDLMKVISKCLTIVVCTRNRNWDNDAYEKGVIEPYKLIQEMYAKLEKTGETPTIEQARAALEMLKNVFETKMVPLDEQLERFAEIFEASGTIHLFREYITPLAEALHS